MVVAGPANFAQQLVGVGVIDQNLIQRDIGDIQKPVLGIDSHAARLDHAIGDDIFGLVVLVETRM